MYQKKFNTNHLHHEYNIHFSRQHQTVALMSFSSLKWWKWDSLSLEMCPCRAANNSRVHSGTGKHGPQILALTVTCIISNQNNMLQHKHMRVRWLQLCGCYSVRHTQCVFISLFRFHKADNHICFDISSQKLTPSRFAQQTPADEFIPLSRQLINKIRYIYILKKKKISRLIIVLIINVKHPGNLSEKSQ